MLWRYTGLVVLAHQIIGLAMWLAGGRNIINHAWLGTSWLMVLLATGGLVCLMAFREHFASVAPWAGALFVGSVVSNVFERVVLGGVADYLWLGPLVANSADVGILLGVFLLVRGMKAT